MLQAYNNNLQVLTPAAPIVFADTIVNNTPCAIDFTKGDSTITLKKQGYYLVQFNGTIVSTAAGDVGIQMLIDGDAAPAAAGSASFEAVGDYDTVTFSTIIPVKCSCCVVDNGKTLSFIPSAATSLNLANVIITKIA